MNFLIVGVGRSGTSLLQSILSSHSKIAIPPETGFIRHNILSWEKNTDLDLEDFFVKDKKLDRVKEFFEDEAKKKYETEIDFYSYFLNKYVDSKEKSIAGDKDPRLVEFIYAVSELFPNAKFIHLVRDPRDVLLSKKKAKWSKDKPSWYHIFAYYVQLKIGERQGNKLPRKQYLSITYESLLAKPENTIEKLCAFLDEEFEESMLSFQDKAKELVSDDEKQWKKETMGPLLTNNTGKWKGEISNWEVALTERLCKQAFNIGDYKKSNITEDLSWTVKFGITLQSTFLKGSGYIYMMYRLISQRILVRWKY